MKTKIILLFASLLFIAFVSPDMAPTNLNTPQHNYLKINKNVNHDSLINTSSSKHDSVKVDSSLFPHKFQQKYAIGYHLLRFMPDESTGIRCKNRTINKISNISNFRNDLIKVFHLLDSIFAQVNFKRLRNDYIDTIVLANPTIIDFFANNENIENIKNYYNSNIDSQLIIKYGNGYFFRTSIYLPKQKKDVTISISKNLITIQNENGYTHNELNLCIYDITGNKIYIENKYFSNQTDIDFSKYRYTIYFLRINGSVYKYIKI